MPSYICETCGVQYAESDTPPESCPICEDERQFVGWKGQRWTTLEELRQTHRNQIETMEPGLTRLGTTPSFAVGQHAFLVEATGGNVLWDCFTLLDSETVAAVEELGGIAVIAVSHPHYFSTIVEWSRAFGNAPIYIHAADREWVTRSDPAMVFWEGALQTLGEGLTLIHGGGHFDGSSMLHWAAGAEGRGALLAGDTIQVVYDRKWVSFMHSFVNYLPLPAAKVRRLAEVVKPFEFERIYSPWPGRVVEADGHEVVRHSAERYLGMIEGT